MHKGSADYADFDRINALSEQAKAGGAAAEELMELAKPFVHLVLRRSGLFPPRGMEWDDLRQEGMIGMIEALAGWKPGSAPFTAFARLCVERQLLEAIKAGTRKKHQVLSNGTSLDAPAMLDKHGHEDQDGADRLSRWELPDLSGIGADPADLVAEEEEEVSPLFEALTEQLSDLERAALIRCILLGQQYQQAAAAMGVSLKSIDNAIQRVRRRVTRRAAELVDEPRFNAPMRALLARIARLKRRKVRQRASNPPPPRQLGAPEQNAHRRIDADPDRHRRYLCYGHLLDPKRRQLLEWWYRGDSARMLAEAIGRVGDHSAPWTIWSQVKRAGEQLIRLEKQFESGEDRPCLSETSRRPG